MPEQRTLSRLEMAILGLISTGSPCTPYWVRRQFQSSASSHFSGSAGAIYPAIRRLEEQGYAQGTGKQTGARKQRNYELTRRGKQKLRDWLMPPFPVEDIAYSYDPIRTRVYCLDALQPVDRLRFVDAAMAQSQVYLAVVKKDCAAHRRAGDLLQYAGARGVLHEVQARIRWLKELHKTLNIQ